MAGSWVGVMAAKSASAFAGCALGATVGSEALVAEWKTGADAVEPAGSRCALSAMRPAGRDPARVSLSGATLRGRAQEGQGGRVNAGTLVLLAPPSGWN